MSIIKQHEKEEEMIVFLNFKKLSTPSLLLVLLFDYQSDKKEQFDQRYHRSYSRRFLCSILIPDCNSLLPNENKIVEK